VHLSSEMKMRIRRSAEQSSKYELGRIDILAVPRFRQLSASSDVWFARHPPANHGFGPAILGQIQRDISGTVLRLPQLYPVYGVVSPRLSPVSMQRQASVVSLPTRVDHGLSHIGNLRSAISTTCCNLLRLAPPAA